MDCSLNALLGCRLFLFLFLNMGGSKHCSGTLCINIGGTTLSINSSVETLIIMELNSISFGSREFGSTTASYGLVDLLKGYSFLLSE